MGDLIQSLAGLMGFALGFSFILGFRVGQSL